VSLPRVPKITPYRVVTMTLGVCGSGPVTIEPGATLTVTAQQLAEEAGLTGSSTSRKLLAPSGDSIITIHLGPSQVPEVARILRSEWPTITAFNPNVGPEFHVRMRQHKTSKVCIIYASVDSRAAPRGARSIFGDVTQRGRVVRTPQQIETAIDEIRRELGIQASGSGLQASRASRPEKKR
jgi:hypothetical protein